MTAVIAVAVFVAAYVFIATDRVHKTVVALVGAALVLGLGVVGSEDAPARCRRRTTVTAAGPRSRRSRNSEGEAPSRERNSREK